MSYIDMATALIVKHEGLKLIVYDDANGAHITEATHVIGHPTIGVGRALDTHGISQAEAYALLNNDIQTNFAACKAIYGAAWDSDAFGDERKAALMDMAHQLGQAGLMGFVSMNSLILAGDWEAAANDALQSKWAKQTPGRAAEIAQILRSGVIA